MNRGQVSTQPSSTGESNPTQGRGKGREVLTTQCLCALGVNMLSQLKPNEDITTFEKD